MHDFVLFSFSIFFVFTRVVFHQCCAFFLCLVVFLSELVLHFLVGVVGLPSVSGEKEEEKEEADKMTRKVFLPAIQAAGTQ